MFLRFLQNVLAGLCFLDSKIQGVRLSFVLLAVGIVAGCNNGDEVFALYGQSMVQKVPQSGQL